ncbi:hypothetical protein Tco_0257080 [Tanacetum coccineum]
MFLTLNDVVPQPVPKRMKVRHDSDIVTLTKYIINFTAFTLFMELSNQPAPTTGETSAPPAPKTAKQLAARRNQERVKSILLLAIPDEYLLKFHNVADAKSL